MIKRPLNRFNKIKEIIFCFKITGVMDSDLGYADVCGKCLVAVPCSYINPLAMKRSWYVYLYGIFAVTYGVHLCFKDSI